MLYFYARTNSRKKSRKPTVQKAVTQHLFQLGHHPAVRSTPERGTATGCVCIHVCCEQSGPRLKGVLQPAASVHSCAASVCPCVTFSTLTGPSCCPDDTHDGKREVWPQSPATCSSLTAATKQQVSVRHGPRSVGCVARGM